MREQGKAVKVIKAVLGIHGGRKHLDGLVMDSFCRTSGEVIGDPTLIYQDITDVFREYYILPMDFDNEMHRASDCQRYAESKPLFTHVH